MFSRGCDEQLRGFLWIYRCMALYCKVTFVNGIFHIKKLRLKGKTINEKMEQLKPTS